MNPTQIQNSASACQERMHKIICENPLIEKTQFSTMILNALIRAGYARRETSQERMYVVDWSAARGDKHIAKIGPKGNAAIERWATAAQCEMQVEPPPSIEEFALAECPICRKFHEHNHGGFE